MKTLLWYAFLAFFAWGLYMALKTGAFAQAAHDWTPG
jgi:hypothetical protein